MEIRAFCKEDTATLERMHRAQGFQYEFPDLEDPLWHVKLVCEQDGRIASAAFAHLTSEVYGFFNHDVGTPRERFQGFMALHEAGCRAAWYPGGLSDLHAWLPPQIEKSFGKRLMNLGWKKSLWPCFFKTLADSNTGRG